MTNHYIVATAGHVDHGKSSLVRALTGTDPDRLPEEKARGITIDLGFARLSFPGESPEQPALEVGIVDVPGHEDFVKNMVAGVGSIDSALLVIAADDGWMPQTEEHLQILEYMDVRRGVVALTKCDLIEDRAAARAHAQERLHGTGLAGAPIVFTSIRTGEGLEELRRAMRENLLEAPTPADFGKPRLWVDRAFSLRGIGTVVTGTLSGGSLCEGQAIVALPTGGRAHIRSLQSHGCSVPRGEPGMRVALNIPEFAPAHDRTAGDRHRIGRGSVISIDPFLTPSETLDVWLARRGRILHPDTRNPRLAHGAAVWLHLGTAKIAGRLILAHKTELRPGESVLAQLRLAAPLAAFRGDRFVVRSADERWTLAGGIVLDPHATRPEFRSPAQQTYLREHYDAGSDVAAAIVATVRRDKVVRGAALLTHTRFSAAQVEAAVATLATHRALLPSGACVYDPRYWNRVCACAEDAIRAHHAQHPAQTGMPVAHLRTYLEERFHPSPEFDAIVAHLCQNRHRVIGASLQHCEHAPALPPSLRVACNGVRDSLARKPLDPPSRKALAPDREREEALRFLIKTGDAIELGHEIILSSAAFASVKQQVYTFLQAHEGATVSEIRQALQISRRIAVPLLERLDRDHITRREGDRRMLQRTLAGPQGTSASSSHASRS